MRINRVKFYSDVAKQFPEQIRSSKHPSGKNKLSKGFSYGKCFEYQENHINAKHHCIYSQLKRILWKKVIANNFLQYFQIHWPPPSCPLTSLCALNGCARKRTEQPCVHAATSSACSGPHQYYFWNGSPFILYRLQGGFGRLLLLLNLGKSIMIL